MDTETSETISVIVVDCNENGVITYGNDALMENFTDVDKACDLATSKLAAGKYVVIRPNTIEHDKHGKFFREWRSFNGAPLKEVRFSV